MTDKGRLSVEELDENIKKHGKLIHKDMVRLCESRSLSQHLCAVFLRKKYSLRMGTSAWNQEILILKDKEELPSGYEGIFSPFFFLKPMSEDYPYLTARNRYSRYACNAEHRLSQFILRNSEKLNSFVPGILHEMLRSLAADDGAQLISKINDLLARLRTFPGGLFNIPDNLLLTEDDLRY